MADPHKAKSRIRIDDDDYEYLCKVAKMMDPRAPNCTQALRQIINEHRIARDGEEWGTRDCMPDTIM